MIFNFFFNFLFVELFNLMSIGEIIKNSKLDREFYSERLDKRYYADED